MTTIESSGNARATSEPAPWPELVAGTPQVILPALKLDALRKRARKQDDIFLDGTRVPDGAEFRTGVAIVGAGPAGIVVALELADRGHHVLLLESGGNKHAGDVSLSTLAESDRHHKPMGLATSRRLGGASNLWGGRCVPFDPIDFEPRPLIHSARWPVTYSEIAAYYQRACDWCVCGEAIFDAREIPSLAARAIVPGLINADVVVTQLERWSLPTNFGSFYRGRLARAATGTVVTDMTCTEIVTEAGGPGVSHLVAKGPTGNRVRIYAEKYVISCGGLETTRLLFASRSQAAAGLGNHSGHLGRWYMAHVDIKVGRVRFRTLPAATLKDLERDPSGVYVRRRFTFAPEVLRGEPLSNAAIWLINPTLADPAHGSAILSFVYLALRSPIGRYFASEALRQAQIAAAKPPRLRDHLANLANGLPGASLFALRFIYERYLRRGRKVPGFYVSSPTNEYALHYHGEHRPNWNSFVEPSMERDRLGMPRLSTHTAFSDQDVDSAIEAHRRLDRYLKRQNVGDVEFTDDDPATAVREQLYAGYHQAGTTRMSDRPEDGVVNRDLAVHGFSDLFIASSSVFVTSSQANSTFTLIALAARLADHLHNELQ